MGTSTSNSFNTWPLNCAKVMESAPREVKGSPSSTDDCDSQKQIKARRRRQHTKLLTGLQLQRHTENIHQHLVHLVLRQLGLAILRRGVLRRREQRAEEGILSICGRRGELGHVHARDDLQGDGHHHRLLDERDAFVIRHELSEAAGHVDLANQLRLPRAELEGGAGHARVVAEGGKRVHERVRGDVCDLARVSDDDAEKLCKKSYKMNQFICLLGAAAEDE